MPQVLGLPAPVYAAWPPGALCIAETGSLRSYRYSGGRRRREGGVEERNLQRWG